ncbi:TPA: hypothetical protein N0F65_002942 [Lagenidium giganteum]|uniref:Ribosome recycling factor domain-containing protein n=1 Tax=Lagenidium giganteum TaxID=4803 RepID=A0AAV2Z3B6_9STRA|nr:TPA: hypothetical protein N0F65_002942 [Lagenidium giganteum]
MTMMSLRMGVCASAARAPAAAPRMALSALCNAPQQMTPILTSTVQMRGFAKKSGKGGKDATKKSSDSAAVDLDQDAAQTYEKTKKNMHGGVVNFTRALSQMRPGKADAGIFDSVHVQAYGQHVALSQVAQVSVSGTYSLAVTIYDPSLIKDIKKAIEAVNPCYSVREDATKLEVSFPKMSKETRAELIKVAKKQAEQARQHVRRVRQDAMNHFKKLKDDVSEDEIKVQQDKIQKLTDQTIEEIGKLLAAKEKDLTAV